VAARMSLQLLDILREIPNQPIDPFKKLFHASTLQEVLDPFDPRVLFNQPEHECRIYGDDNAQTWAVVSPQHYQACIQHRWRWKKSRDRGRPTKEYLSRNVQVIHHKGTGWRANRTQHNLFLHHFIMELAGKPRPSKRHIVDHRDGDERNCREENLRWASPGLNRLNRNGSHAGEEHDENANSKRPTTRPYGQMVR
jgi:hypothetical protein